LILALGADVAIAKEVADVLKHKFSLYEADTDRLEERSKKWNQIVKEILESYAQAEFFTKLPEIAEEGHYYIAGEGDIYALSGCKAGVLKAAMQIKAVKQMQCSTRGGCSCVSGAAKG
jgi:aconitase B